MKNKAVITYKVRCKYCNNYYLREEVRHSVCRTCSAKWKAKQAALKR